ncbi:MAG: sigma-54 dependent transcriptional regulator, partial [Desulfovibrionaceae bacterium]
FAVQPETTVEILNFLVALCPPLTTFIFTVLAEEKLDSTRTGKGQVNSAFDVPFEMRLVNTADMARTMSLVNRMSVLNIPLLITGETGTGKSMLARYIHQCSPRRSANFVKVNCPSLVPTLFESEMFGHTKGAFTGANTKRMGRIEMAHEGTLFLDEIAELSPDMQCKLLQILEERSFERVGESHQQYVDMRLISATNVDITKALAEKRLRQDLYYRLASVVVFMPPLRERKNDITVLLNYFINKFEMMYSIPRPTLTAEVLDLLHNYAWPGNIRELRNIVNHLILNAIDHPLTPRMVREMLYNSAETGIPISSGDTPLAETAAPTAAPVPSRLATLQEHEKAYIQHVIALAHGKLSGPQGAAALLHIPRSTLQHRIRKLGIQV